jgi:hypothetical protein
MNDPYKISIDGKEYTVAWVSDLVRVIIDYEGLYVLADFVYPVWELSGRPADARERAELERLTAGMRDVSVVTVLEKP